VIRKRSVDHPLRTSQPFVKPASRRNHAPGYARPSRLGKELTVLVTLSVTSLMQIRKELQAFRLRSSGGSASSDRSGNLLPLISIRFLIGATPLRAWLLKLKILRRSGTFGPAGATSALILLAEVPACFSKKTRTAAFRRWLWH